LYEPWKTGTATDPRVPAQKILVLQGGVLPREMSGSAPIFPGLALDSAGGSAGGDENSTRFYLCEWTDPDTITSTLEDNLKLLLAHLKEPLVARTPADLLEEVVNDRSRSQKADIHDQRISADVKQQLERMNEDGENQVHPWTHNPSMYTHLADGTFQVCSYKYVKGETIVLSTADLLRMWVCATWVVALQQECKKWALSKC
jgi:hypothetical protein